KTSLKPGRYGGMKGLQGTAVSVERKRRRQRADGHTQTIACSLPAPGAPARKRGRCARSATQPRAEHAPSRPYTLRNGDRRAAIASAARGGRERVGRRGAVAHTARGGPAGEHRPAPRRARLGAALQL